LAPRSAAHPASFPLVRRTVSIGSRLYRRSHRVFSRVTPPLVRAGNSNIVVRVMVSGNLTVWRIVEKILFNTGENCAQAATIGLRDLRGAARPGNAARR
jgi:hypothetical protein